MKRYVIVREDHDRTEFVTLPGSERSYTKDIGKARRFESREEAEHSRCDNERIADIEEFLT